MSTHQSIPKPANAKKKSDILPIPAQSKSHPVIAQPKIESTRSNEEQLAQMRAKREASERLGSTLLTPESVPRTLPPLQPKLTIGQPNDQYEQEADRVARQVVDHINAPPKIQAKTPRNPMSVEARKPSPLDHLPAHKVQRYATGGQMAAPADLESSIQRARGGGQPLGDGIRERMEGAFGADFSGVRVHTDGTSDQLNQSIQAKAFTTGQDVFFRQGAYEPGNRGGQELLAHELTHVVQQQKNKNKSEKVIQCRRPDRGQIITAIQQQTLVMDNPYMLQHYGLSYRHHNEKVIFLTNAQEFPETNAESAKSWWRALTPVEFEKLNRNGNFHGASYGGIAPNREYIVNKNKFFTNDSAGSHVVEFITPELGWLYQLFLKENWQPKPEGGGTYGLGPTGHGKGLAGSTFNKFLKLGKITWELRDLRIPNKQPEIDD